MEPRRTSTSQDNKSCKRKMTCWKKRSKLEKYLICGALALIFISTALAAILATHLTTESNLEDLEKTFVPKNSQARINNVGHEDNSDVCLSEICIHSAAEIISNLDLSMDPCDNFYKFACNGFENKNSIPEEKSVITSISRIKTKLDLQLREIAEETINVTEPKSYQYVKSLYRSCLNKNKINKDGLKPLEKIIAKLGGWPVIEGENWSTNSTWYEDVYKLRQLGYSVDYFVDFSVTTDFKSAVRVLNLDKADLGLNREHLLKDLKEDTEIFAYHKYQVDLAVLFGAKQEFAQTEMMEVLEFEKQLANFSLSKENRRNDSLLYNPMTIEELEGNFTFVPWLEYFNNLLPNKTKVTKDENVVVYELEYLKNFQILINQTERRVQQNYLIWRVATDSITYLSDDARKLQLEYFMSLTGLMRNSERWKECVRIITSSLLANAIGSNYVKRHFPESSKIAAWDIVNNIHSAFLIILNSTTWMDSQTKLRAYEKAISMSANVGYPQDLLNETLLDGLYEGLEINKETYLENVLSLSIMMTDYSFNSLRRGFNESGWVTIGRPAVINAFYDRLGNSMIFPAGVLMGNLFNKDRPNYLNFGAIGWVIGHEITHGFDDRGRQFDSKGNLNNWWERDTELAFLQRAKCIINQYNNYTSETLKLKINGVRTQGENIADLGGINSAYWAYQIWSHKNGKEKKLPGLNFTQNQLFWISAANIYCSKVRPEALRQEISTNSHAPGEFRVIGTFSNMKEFSKDFSCQPNSPMNPNAKCQVF